MIDYDEAVFAGVTLEGIMLKALNNSYSHKNRY